MSVSGYWLIKNYTNGHAAVLGKLPSTSPSQTPLLGPDVYQKLGAKIGDPLVSYYLGGDPNNLGDQLQKGMGQLQVSTDQVLTGFNTKNTRPTGYFQALNFDSATPFPLNANAYQQALSKAGADALKTTQDVAKGVQSITSVADVLAVIWQKLTNPTNWLRALELLGGTALIYMAIHSMTSGGQSPASAT